MERIKNRLKKYYGRLYTVFHTPWKMYSSIGVFVNISKNYICIKGTEHISIGNHVRILDNVRIEAISHYGIQSFSPNLEIEDKVLINQNFHCTCAASIHIGEGTAITANCGIFDIIHPYTDITLAPKDQPIQSKPVYIGKNCMIGMNSVIQPGVILGDHVIVGSNSTVLAGEYPPFSVLVGSPARVVKRYDDKTKLWRSL